MGVTIDSVFTHQRRSIVHGLVVYVYVAALHGYYTELFIFSVNDGHLLLLNGRGFVPTLYLKRPLLSL